MIFSKTQNSLMIINRLNSRALLHRKHFVIEDYSCVLCGQHTFKTIDHLFLHCPFAQICQTYICPTWAPNQLGIQDEKQKEMDNIKSMLVFPFALGITILVSWAIWTTRNDYIFKGREPNLYSCRDKFEEEPKWIIFRAKRKEYQNFETWACSFRQLAQGTKVYSHSFIICFVSYF